MRWFLSFLLAITSVGDLGALAGKEGHPALSKEALRCKTSLEQFRLRLKVYSKQENLPYYKDLYQQVQIFLGAVGDPVRSFQLDKCENLLNAIQDIIGLFPERTRVGPAELAPMPTEYSSPHEGKLTNPTLETIPKRPLRSVRSMSIHYRYDDLEFDKKEKGEEPDDFQLTSTSTSAPCRSGTKKTPNLKDKELE